MAVQKRVVVTGAGILCSLGHCKSDVIKNMARNRTGIGKITRFSTESFATQIGAEIKNFNPADHFTDEEVQGLNPAAQIAIVAVKEAVEDSGIQMYASTTGLAFGTCNAGITSVENKDLCRVTAEDYRKYPFYQQADSVAGYFKLNGPVVTVNTACVASGGAIGCAFDLIKEGQAEMMIAGGSDVMSLVVYAGFNRLQALNGEPCSPYSRKTGLSLGEGAAFVVLEEWESALRRKAAVYAEICAYGLSNDAYHETAPEPQGSGIGMAVKMAVEKAGIDKSEIGYINTHGTGTSANDAAELNGLRHFFGETLLNKMPLSSSKAYFGHNLGGAAAIEYVTALLAMRDHKLPATLHFEEAREGCDDVDLIKNEMRDTSMPRYFLCNNSAFGGHNCSIVSQKPDLAEGGKEAPPPERVAIAGMGMVRNTDYRTGSSEAWSVNAEEEGKFSLKKYNSALYARRMNTLTQFSIAANDLALKDAGLEWEPHELGLSYGTAKGSLSSAEIYLSGIYQKGPEHASAIYFPHMVLNSIAGTLSRKIGIRGYANSLSSGGNDGLLSLINAYYVIRNHTHPFCLASAGDEKSMFAELIDTSYGLDKTPYEKIEGSTALLLTAFHPASHRSVPLKAYAEITGVGQAFNQRDRAIGLALKGSGKSMDDVDLILLCSNGLEGNQEKDNLEHAYDMHDKVICLNDCLGYADSISGLNHVFYAAGLLAKGGEAWNPMERMAKRAKEKLSHILLVNSTKNGNNAAVLLSGIR